MNFEEEVKAQDNNLRTTLELVVEDVGRMIRSRDDSVLKFPEVRFFSVDELAQLERSLEDLRAVIQRLHKGEHANAIPVTDICKCAVHVAFLHKASVSKMRSLMFIDPGNLATALHLAEKSGGVRQSHLYSLVALRSRMLRERTSGFRDTNFNFTRK